ncbi:MAG TPA: hypothetical protein VLW55_01080 [Burkholderiaceae bacterium]|nr:hypothetical protein [Burkholderiaceae bacterium]
MFSPISSNLAHAVNLPVSSETASNAGDGTRPSSGSPFAEKHVDPLVWMPHLGVSPLEALMHQK